MTTVAIDLSKKTMAADSKASLGWNVSFETQKLWQRSDGALAGFSGDLAAGLIFVDWFMSGLKKKSAPKYPEGLSFNAIVLTDDGCFFYDSSNVACPMLSKYFAIGSGSEVAIAAMKMGKSVKEAVEFACENDGGTGGPVMVKKLGKFK